MIEPQQTKADAVRLTKEVHRQTLSISEILGESRSIRKLILPGLDGPKVSFADAEPVSESPTIRELALLWFAFQGPANREQEDGTLVFCMR